jgi:O-antigen/teichoic acid export membrane protein
MIHKIKRSYLNLTTKKKRYLSGQLNSSVIKNFFIYSFGNIVLRSITALFIPILLSILSPSEYGLFSLVNNFSNILAIALGLGLRQVFFIEFFHHDIAGRKKMVNEVLILYITIATPIALLLFSQTGRMNHYLFCDAASVKLIALSLFYWFIFFFAELFYQILRYQSKALKLTVIQTTAALTTAILNLVNIYFFGLGSLA